MTPSPATASAGRASPPDRSWNRHGRPRRAALPWLILVWAGLLAPVPSAGQDIHLDSLGYDYGSPDASVQVIELSDFGCSYCRSFHLDVYPTLFAEYVETGLVRWKYVTYVSGMFRNSMAASRVAECVGEQGSFDAMRDRLFEDQPEWSGLSDPMPRLLELAEAVGAHPGRVADCVEAGVPERRLDDGIRFGLLSGVRGTPTFLIDGFPVMGALPVDFMRELLDRRVAAHAQAEHPRR